MSASRAPRGARLRTSASRLLKLVLNAVLACGLLLQPPLAAQPAWGLNLPSLGRAEQGARPSLPLMPVPPGGRLQEVEPPVAVQQLQRALAEHLPQVEILSPRDGANLSDGPWQLKLKVRDWPLADGGALGIGAHVVVQIDTHQPQRISGSEHGPWQAASGNGERTLVVPQEPLTPGSHRLTVYAARPWGEAVKSPGAAKQIRLHRLAANPQVLPEPGTPQLLPVSPGSSNAAEPLLLDWLLLDAPLQNLRDGDGSWRLQVTINGDRFVVDQAVPLWLRGWKNGSNSLQLELVDGSGEPLNAPFNSFVEAIDLAAPGSEGGAAKPRWLQGRLSADELAILLGEQAPLLAEPEAAEGTSNEQQAMPIETRDTDAPLQPQQDTRNQQAQDDNADQDLNAAEEIEAPPEQASAEAGPVEDAQAEAEEEAEAEAESEEEEEEEEEEAEPEPEPDAEVDAEAGEDSTADAQTDAQAEMGSGLQQEAANAPTMSSTEDPSPENTMGQELDAGSGQNPAPPSPEAASPLVLAAPERISSSTPLEGSARDQVNPDGSLIQPPARGPLGSLRQLLQPR